MPTTEIANPYLAEVVRLNGSEECNQHNRYMVFNYDFMGMGGLERRSAMIQQYGFSVPTPEALALVADHGPIIELGAGCAYWASLLRQMGVDVLAFDKYPPGGRTKEKDGGYGWSTSWTDVREGDQSVAANYPERTLLMIWPSLWEPWAHEALKVYRGATVIYVGEYGGCTADDAFHEALERDWTETANASVYQWFGIHDHLYVYQRSPGGTSNDNN